jgi:hypothetical protein
MAELNQEVAERVRQDLTNNPEMGSRQLFDMAQEMDPSLSSLSVQQFHGRYVLPVRRDQAAQREQSGEVRPPKKARKSSRPKRAAKRGTDQAAEGEDTQQESAASIEATPTKAAHKGAGKSARKGAAKKSRPDGEKDAVQQQSAQTASEPASPGPQTVGREQVRAVFLQFARDFSEAESRTEIVQVLSKLDEYVDQVVQGAR